MLGRQVATLDVPFRLAVICIGLVLPAWLYLTELHPRLLLIRKELDFSTLAAACDQAVRATEMAEAAWERISPAQASLLEKAFETGRAPCNRYAELKEYLLSQNVSQHALSALHLSATSDPSYPDLFSDQSGSKTLDAELSYAVERFGLAPLPLKAYVRDAKYRLGEKLFNERLLSGHGDRSCATCHKAEFAMADANALELRLDTSSDFAPVVPARNVPDLWNRDHNDVSAMLWDGRLTATKTLGEQFLLPDAVSTKDFENLMAVQSVRPIFIPGEMLGEPGRFNRLAPEVNLEPQVVLARVPLVLFSKGAAEAPVDETYARLFQDSFGVTKVEQVEPSHLGNALAHYIEIEFQSRDTPWDRYLGGDQAAISIEQKKGALLFYGIAKCVVCHNGDVFSDFQFHSVGVPDDRSEKDLGRYYATLDPADQFLFKTPPLRNSTLTAPYFHNGQAKTLLEAVQQHLSPFRFAREYAESGEHLMEPAEIDAISPILITSNVLTDEQVGNLIAFLKSLEDQRASTLQN